MRKSRDDLANPRVEWSVARHGKTLRDQDGCSYLLFYEGGYVLPTFYLVSPCENPSL